MEHETGIGVCRHVIIGFRVVLLLVHMERGTDHGRGI